MNKYISSVQKRIGLLIFIISLVVFIDNFIEHFLVYRSIIHTFGELGVWLMLVIVIIFFMSIIFENRLFKFVQITLILLTGIINTMQSYNQVFGPGLYLAAWLLMRHYGFLDKWRKTKYIFLTLTLIIITQISAYLYTDKNVIFAGSGILEFSVFIVIFIVIIWRDLILEQNKLRIENKSLKINYTRIRDQLIELEKDQQPYNLKAVKITPAEERVIKTLTIFKASNREIAERLNIAESTVKLHLYNIYNKIGVDNRFAIIDLCKYNYT